MVAKVQVAFLLHLMSLELLGGSDVQAETQPSRTDSKAKWEKEGEAKSFQAMGSNTLGLLGLYPSWERFT